MCLCENSSWKVDLNWVLIVLYYHCLTQRKNGKEGVGACHNHSWKPPKYLPTCVCNYITHGCAGWTWLAKSEFMNERLTFRFAPAARWKKSQRTVWFTTTQRWEGGSDVTGDGVGVICESERKEGRGGGGRGGGRVWRRRKTIRKRGEFGI